MEETKSVTINPEHEQEVIDEWQDFGWTLLSSQEVKNIDNHLERRGNEIYQISNTEHYVKLVFKRDMKMPHYAELCEYEKEYNSAINEPRKSIGGFIFLLIFSCCCCVGAFVTQIYYLLIPGIIGIGLFSFLIARNTKKNKAIDGRNLNRRQQKAELRQKSRNLLT